MITELLRIVLGSGASVEDAACCQATRDSTDNYGALILLADIKGGDLLIADDGFTCMPAGQLSVAASHDGQLFVPCNHGVHYLNGQTDSRGRLVGFRR